MDTNHNTFSLANDFCYQRQQLYQQDKADILAPCVAGLLDYKQPIYLAVGKKRLLYRYEGHVPAIQGRLVAVPEQYQVINIPAVTTLATTAEPSPQRMRLRPIEQAVNPEKSSLDPANEQEREVQAQQWGFIELIDQRINSYLKIRQASCIKDDIEYDLHIQFSHNNETHMGCGHILNGPA